VRDQFLVEIATAADGVGTRVDTLAELNSLFTAWVEQVYHQRLHSETGQAPLARFLAAGPPVPTPAELLTEAFRWGEWRTVTKTATVSLHGNLYEVDPAFAGSKVELVFDPFDLTDITVRHHGRPAGKATPFKIGRHVHPKAAADPPPPVTPSGVDYLRLLEDRQTRALGERLRYAQLTEPTPTELTGSITGAPENQPPAALQPATDHDGLRYDADLLTLAAQTSSAAADPVEVTG